MKNITLKDLVKASKGAKGDRLLISANGTITDGRTALHIDNLDVKDRAGLILPVELPAAPLYVNCTTEEQAAKNNADIKAANTARELAQEHNDEATARLSLLTGVKDCRVLPGSSDEIFKGPESCRAYTFTGMIYAPAVGTGAKHKLEICIFEEAPEDRGTLASYNLVDPAAHAAYEHEKAERETAGAAYQNDCYNEPEAPKYGAASTLDKEENRAPGAKRRIGINRKYVELFSLGDKSVYMDSRKDCSMVFCGSAPAAGAPFTGIVVMPMRSE